LTPVRSDAIDGTLRLMTGPSTQLAKDLVEERQRAARDRQRAMEAIRQASVVPDQHAFQRALVRASLLLVPGRTKVTDRR